MWPTLRHDWTGFLGFVHTRFVAFDLAAAPTHDDGLWVFSRFLADHGEMTLSEAIDMLEVLIVPAWYARDLDSVAA